MALTRINNQALINAEGTVLQVKSFQRTAIFEQGTHGSMADCGVSINITPKSSSSKILILVSGTLGNDTLGNATVLHLLRDGTKIAAGSSATIANYNGSAFHIGSATYETNHFSINHLDSPATTSHIT